jgi:phosphocarrier protein HPr
MSLEKELTIRNKMGMHARPAAQFVKRASKYQCDVWVEKDDEPVNGKSIMGLMMLAAGKGETIKLITDGVDAEAAMTDLEELVSSGFGDVE